ncbi:MAG: ATP-binding protein [Anaerovoracaceae bacterium]
MKKQKWEPIIIFLLVLAIIGIAVYPWFNNPLRIEKKKVVKTHFTQAEQNTLDKKEEIKIGVSSEFSYLKDGFLEGYVGKLLEPLGKKITLVSENDKNAEGIITTMNDDLRNSDKRFLFTTPIFQTNGRIFLKEGRSAKLTGVVKKGTFTKTEKKHLSYEGEKIKIQETDSVEDAVTLAKEKKIDCILGDQLEVTSYLKAKNMEKEYLDLGETLYENNVSIVVKAENKQMYNIMNLAIYNGDKYNLMNQAKENWYGISEPLVKGNGYEDTAGLLFVIFAAVLCVFFLYYQSNKNLYMELTNRMNQLLESKQELQTTFNGMPYYLAELDTSGIIMDINRAFLQRVSREPIGKHISQVFDFPKEVLDAGIKSAVSLTESDSMEISVKQNIFEVDFFPIENQRGEAEKILFMAIDVTKVKMAERQMRQDNKMIAIGQLAAGVAHEIRNPLGIIRNYCYILKNIDNENTRKDAVKNIEKSVETSNNIIENLLNFSRVSTGAIEWINMKGHLENLLVINEGKLKKKHIQSEICCEEEFKAKVQLESFDMVLMNLISNGIDAMDEGGIFTVRLTKDDQEKEFILEVTDTGAGIPQEIVEEIYNPFFTTKGDTKGTGLGLYIVYNEVKKMNGDITVNSKLDEGTTFTVRFPLEAEND